MSLDELPAEAVAYILSFTSPRDIKRLALVSKSYLEVSRYDQVWSTFLPPHWQDTDVVWDPTLPLYQVYDKLCVGVTEGSNEHQILKLVPSSGAITRFRSAISLNIVWGDDIRYWSWLRIEGSTFDEVAYLTRVCWLEVRGYCKAWWKPGKYRVALRLAFDSRRQWNHPVTSTLTVDEQLVTEKIENLVFQHTTWIEYEVGEFVVTDEDAAAAPIQVGFSMLGIESRRWKKGLAIDSMVITQIISSEDVSNSIEPAQVHDSNTSRGFGWLARQA